MSKNERNIGQEILDGIREIKAYKAGQVTLKSYTVQEPASPRLIRQRLQLSQTKFACLMGVSTRTIQDWEQGKRSPKGTAKVLLQVVEQHPEIFDIDYS